MIAETHAIEEPKNLLPIQADAALTRDDKRSFRRTLGLIAKLRETIEGSVPFGYQDETGFHYGAKH